jgi:predicted NUDIX family NTP pyrophosphohydrolase
MGKISAGLLMYRKRGGTVEVLLVHPGGPYWAKKDLGAWTIPKGECAPNEDLLACARREFEEETGFVPTGPFTPLVAIKQPGGKIVHTWSSQGDWDPAMLRSDTFTMEWLPGSGQQREFPEIDRAAWYRLDEARKRILKSQGRLLDELERVLSRGNARD